MRGIAVVLGAALLAGATGAAAQTSGCNLCHGELELLRQRVQTPVEARALFVPAAAHGASAHGELACQECHRGFGRFPHGEGTATSTCASCHEDADAAWARGIHAEAPEGSRQAGCTECHGVHDVVALADLEQEARASELNGRCVSCHATATLPPADPHAGSISCTACHGAHDTKSVDDPSSAIAVARQEETCGACHVEVEAAWRGDAHGAAVSLAAEREPAPPVESLPGCTGCHGGHGVVAVADSAFPAASTERCAACHDDAARTYYGSYHGKAARLGSAVAATCQDCHGSHGVYPRTDSRSAVAEARLVETCGGCHEHARPAFVQYDSHPDPLNRARNPWIFWSFVMMNALLVGVLGVFGLHTVLWWVRLLIDRRRGQAHAHGGES